MPTTSKTTTKTTKPGKRAQQRLKKASALKKTQAGKAKAAANKAAGKGLYPSESTVTPTGTVTIFSNSQKWFVP